MLGLGSVGHWILVLLIIFLLFGAQRIPEIMKDLAKGFHSFKRGLENPDEAERPETFQEKPKPLASKREKHQRSSKPASKHHRGHKHHRRRHKGP